MASVEKHTLPEQALLAKYAGSGGYADCFATEIPRQISHAEFVEAFYTGAVFKIERLLLSWFISKPSTDAQARELATGARNDFAAWTVEGRAPDQLLMRDYRGSTRSWLMVAPIDASSTRLFFGSAVVPKKNRTTGETKMGFVFKALLGFHQLYSRVLLHAARTRLERNRP
jgi:hypothetical protein